MGGGVLRGSTVPWLHSGQQPPCLLPRRCFYVWVLLRTYAGPRPGYPLRETLPSPSAQRVCVAEELGARVRGAVGRDPAYLVAAYPAAFPV